MNRLNETFKLLKLIKNPDEFLEKYNTLRISEAKKPEFNNDERTLLLNINSQNIEDLLKGLSEPEMVQRELEQEELLFLNHIIYHKWDNLNQDCNCLMEELKSDLLRNHNYKTFKVSNQKEKLETILGKRVISKEIESELTDENKELVRNTRNIIQNINRFPSKKRIWEGYSMDLTIAVSTKKQEPLLKITKEYKHPLRVAVKMPREILQEAILRTVDGLPFNLDTNDGRARDLSGQQLVTVIPPQDKSSSQYLNKNPHSALTHFFYRNQTFENKLTYHERNDGYRAGHIKSRRKENPRKDILKREKPDIFETQIIDINVFMNKEIGKLNQHLYAVRQENFMDYEFEQKLRDKGKLTEARKFIKKNNKFIDSYIENAKSQIHKVLTYHQTKAINY